MNSNFGKYRNRLFVEVWGDADTFYEDYTTCGIPATLQNGENAKTLFYLLYARYGNNPIASTDTNRFKYMLFSLIYQYGPTWEKKLSVQKALRDMDVETLKQGGRNVNNLAYNPDTEPANDAMQALPFISEQRSQGSTRSLIDGYAILLSLLEDDVTGSFLDKFRTLFVPIASPQTPLYYITRPENQEA